MDQAPPPPPPPQPPPPPPPFPPPGSGTSIPQRGIGDILSAAFDVYRRNWQTLMAITAVVAIPFAFVQTFITHQLTRSVVVETVNLGNGTRTVVRTSPGFGRSLLAELTLALLWIFLFALLTGAITRAVASETAGLSIDLSDSYSYAGGVILPILWVGLLTGLAVGLGFILLIIPGIFLLVKLSVGVPSLVIENRRGTAAMSRSWELVQGCWWHVFGALILAWIISGIASAILSAPFSSWPVRAIGSAVAQVVTLPFTTTVGVLLYLDLRARREALTVETLRNELQSQAA